MIKNVLYTNEEGHTRLLYDMLLPVMEHPDFSCTNTVLAVEPKNFDYADHLFGDLLPVVLDNSKLGGNKLISIYPMPVHIKRYGSTKVYKLSYGIGNDTWCRAFPYPRGLRNYLGWGPQDCQCIAPNQTVSRLSLGATKFLNHSGVEKLRSMIDPSKRTILIVGTWRKDASSKAKCHPKDGTSISGYADLSQVANYLAVELSDNFNILYKPHHHAYHLDNANRGEYGIIIHDPEIATQAFYDVADLVIADYGGSAVEAVMSKRVLYVDEVDCTAPFTDTDVALHQLLPSVAGVHELSSLVMDHDLIDLIPTIEGALGTEHTAQLRRRLFGDIEHSVTNWIEFLAN